MFTIQLDININQYAIVFITKYYLQLTFLETKLQFHILKVKMNQNQINILIRTH